MNNLIPPEFQRKLYFIYLGRLSVVVAVVFIFIAVVFCAALIPSYVLTHQRLSLAKNTLAEAQKSESIKADIELRKVLNESKTIVALADSAIPALSYNEYLEKVISMRVAGVTLDSFDFKSDGVDGQSVVVTGVAKNRDVLVQFAKNFTAKENNGFGPVTIPVENFQKKVSIPFTLVIPIVKKL